MTTDGALARFARDYPAGTVVFREGELGEEMYVIQSGHVRIQKRVGSRAAALASGNEVGKDAATDDRVLATLGAGEFFGEMAILNDKPRTATAVVADDGPARILVIDAHRFEQMVIHNREITVRLIKKLAARLASADALIEILMHKDPRARVMRGLARLAETFGEEQGNGRRVGISREELGAQVNAEPEEVEEVLGRLRRVRVISIEPTAIVVHDMDRLLDFLEFLEMPQRFAGSASGSGYPGPGFPGGGFPGGEGDSP